MEDRSHKNRFNWNRIGCITRHDVYNLTLSNPCLSILDGSIFLNEDNEFFNFKQLLLS